MCLQCGSPIFGQDKQVLKALFKYSDPNFLQLPWCSPGRVIDVERKDLLNYVKESLAEINTCIEIGVGNSDHAILIKNIVKPNKLYLLNAWGLSKTYNKLSNTDIKTFLHSYENTKKHFFNDENVIIIRGFSTREVCIFENNFFDFIYIDADHTYDAVKEDLGCWFPKLKKGGIIAGHDYCLKNVDQPNEYGVIKAVDEFRDTNKYIIKNFKAFGSGLKTCWLLETKYF